MLRSSAKRVWGDYPPVPTACPLLLGAFPSCLPCPFPGQGQSLVMGEGPRKAERKHRGPCAPPQ